MAKEERCKKKYIYKKADLALLRNQLIKIVSCENCMSNSWDEKFTYNILQQMEKYRVMSFSENQKYHLDRIISKYFQNQDFGNHQDYGDYHSNSNIFGENIPKSNDTDY
tara:strand:+ start:99 stop:425 length:327 start_codon:yes stop_codon:yes gene_type:complete